MKKQILGGIAILAIAAVATFNVSLNAQENKTPNINLKNVEALSQGEDDPGNYYEKQRIDTIEIWDDQTETYKKVTVITCEGKGSIKC